MPERIQLRRTRGWRKPEGAIVVARPSRWGNPYAVMLGRDLRPTYFDVDRHAIFVVKLDKSGHRTGTHFAGFADTHEAAAFAVNLFAKSLEGTYQDIDGPLRREHYLGDLRGHDLACWCPLDQPCHADTLLRLANR